MGSLLSRSGHGTSRVHRETTFGSSAVPNAGTGCFAPSRRREFAVSRDQLCCANENAARGGGLSCSTRRGRKNLPDERDLAGVVEVVLDDAVHEGVDAVVFSGDGRV